MTQKKRTVLESRTIHLPHTDIDTDQIIPARFLTTISDSGFGEMAFADWRYSPAGERREGTPFDALRDGDISILVAGHNFGCGSSREHAVWALRDLGIRAVISSRIADIFAANALKNGLAPIVVDEEFHSRLWEHPEKIVRIDLENLQVTVDEHTTEFTLDRFSQKMLVEGHDHLDHLMQKTEAITAHELRGGSTPWTR
jgi:3-isopropylmalate/(R)-2-methylmalate dehydratase small subunit